MNSVANMGTQQHKAHSTSRQQDPEIARLTHDHSPHSHIHNITEESKTTTKSQSAQHTQVGKGRAGCSSPAAPKQLEALEKAISLETKADNKKTNKQIGKQWFCCHFGCLHRSQTNQSCDCEGFQPPCWEVRRRHKVKPKEKFSNPMTPTEKTTPRTLQSLQDLSLTPRALFQLPLLQSTRLTSPITRSENPQEFPRELCTDKNTQREGRHALLQPPPTLLKLDSILESVEKKTRTNKTTNERTVRLIQMEKPTNKGKTLTMKTMVSLEGKPYGRISRDSSSSMQSKSRPHTRQKGKQQAHTMTVLSRCLRALFQQGRTSSIATTSGMMKLTVSQLSRRRVRIQGSRDILTRLIQWNTHRGRSISTYGKGLLPYGISRYKMVNLFKASPSIPWYESAYVKGISPYGISRYKGRALPNL